MFKVFYNLSSDLIDRAAGNVGLFDVLTASKINICTELGQLRGEKIDVAYINYDEKLLSQISDLQIKKISVVTRGDDDIVIPKNFIKYSSEQMMLLGKKCYNIIMNHKNYKTDNEIIIIGDENIYQDVVRNIYTLFGNVITCTMNKQNIAELDTHIQSRMLPNTGNIYFTVYKMLEGLGKCVIRKNIIKVNSNEYFSDLSPILYNLQSDNKLIITNLNVKRVSSLKFSIGEHLIAGKYDQLAMMFSNAMGILNNKVCDIRKKLRLEYNPEQILVLGYLKDSIDYIAAKTDTYVKQIMMKHFTIIPIDELGAYRIPCGPKHILMSGKNMNKDLYASLCEVKMINDI